METLLPQVDDIPAVALTARAIAEDPTLWDRVANGEYRIVYATEQTILDKSGPFSKQIIKKPGCAFMKNLCLIAVDECHVIHEWQGFRPQYAYLGSLRLTFSRVPWAVMSATLTPNASAYIHEVLCLKRGTFRISLPLHRDNINIEVAATDGKSLQPLYDLIPEQLSDLNELQKTIIFTDTVDPSIDIAALLAQHLPERFGRMRNTAVAAYYGDLGAETKAKVLKDFTTGRTRIVVCTDAFGLGVDIPDITRCVQWQVTDKLNVARLCQRIGRCVRAKDLEGVAIVYASREILADVPKGQWEEAWAEENNVVNVLQGYEDDDLAVPISKNRKFNLYGIPVTRETEGLCKQFTSQLYAKVDSLSKAIQQAASELVGTPTNKVSMSMKLDPPLLWFLTTEGCRHRVFGMIFRDPVLWTAKHRYWCCDNCAIASGRKLEEISTHGISPVLSYSNPSPPPKKRRNAPSKRTGPSRPTPVTADHIRLLEARLKVTREAFWESANVPDTFPELWLPNKPLAWIAKHAKRITNVEQLTQELESQGFRPKRSFLSPEHLNHIVWVLDVTLSSGIFPLLRWCSSPAQMRGTPGVNNHEPRILPHPFPKTRVVPKTKKTSPRQDMFPFRLLHHQIDPSNIPSLF